MFYLQRLSAWLSRHLIWVLLASYALAAAWPAPGLALRAVHLGTLGAGATALRLGGPTLMLMFLLFNAALAVDTRQLRATAQRPGLLLAAIAANLTLPALFMGAATLLLGGWPDAVERHSLLLGLAILAVMPIAGSSTAWAQEAGGNVALSLGLVLSTTLLSPLVTPLCLRLLSCFADDALARGLHALSGTQTQLFLLVAVVAPCLLGLATRWALPRPWVLAAMPILKLCSKLLLLLLNYANAAVALPEMTRAPDWGYLAIAVGLAASLCTLRYLGGYAVGRLARAAAPETTSVMFGLGMNNNGSGLVLAAQQLPEDAELLLLIVAYNIAQQIGAGYVHRRRTRAA